MNVTDIWLYLGDMYLYASLQVSLLVNQGVNVSPQSRFTPQLEAGSCWYMATGQQARQPM
jgi:hypothetical protein